MNSPGAVLDVEVHLLDQKSPACELPGGVPVGHDCFRLVWSVLKMNFSPYRYGCRSRTVQPIPRHYLLVEQYLRSWAVMTLLKHPIGLRMILLSSVECFCIKTQPSCLSHALVSTTYLRPGFWRVRTRSDVSFSFCASKAASSLASSSGKFSPYVFFSCCVNGVRYSCEVFNEPSVHIAQSQEGAHVG